MANNLAGLLEAVRRWGVTRIAIIGVGNPLNGDDSAGPHVAQLLIEKMSARSAGEPILVLDAGPSPEAFSGPLRRFAPEMILMVDAAELGEPPGTIGWFDWSAAQGMSASTHSLPPSLLARFLVDDLGCRMVLIGIQPRQLDLDGGESPEVTAAVDQVVRALETLF